MSNLPLLVLVLSIDAKNYLYIICMHASVYSTVLHVATIIERHNLNGESSGKRMDIVKYAMRRRL